MNPELTTGSITITTSYDNVVLDNTGSDETNRKFVTTVAPSTLVFSDFKFIPFTECEIANYSLTIKPAVKKKKFLI